MTELEKKIWKETLKPTEFPAEQFDESYANKAWEWIFERSDGQFVRALKLIPICRQHSLRLKRAKIAGNTGRMAICGVFKLLTTSDGGSGIKVPPRRF